MCEANSDCVCDPTDTPPFTDPDFKVYKIKTFNDFMKVPPESVDACMAAFTQFIKFNQGMLALLSSVVAGTVEDEDVPDISEEDRTELKKLLDSGMVATIEEFTWTDDGKPGCSGFEVNMYSEDEDGNRELFESVKMSASDV